MAKDLYRIAERVARSMSGPKPYFEERQMAHGVGLWFDTYPAVLLVEPLRSGRYLVQFSWSYDTRFDEKESVEFELGTYKAALTAVTHAMAAAKLSPVEIRQLFDPFKTRQGRSEKPWTRSDQALVSPRHHGDASRHHSR